MESLFSFPVGLLHPLQHAGLSRRSPSCQRSKSAADHAGALDRVTHKKTSQSAVGYRHACRTGRCEMAKWDAVPLRHQNQPPDGSRPLRRRYVTRLP